MFEQTNQTEAGYTAATEAEFSSAFESGMAAADVPAETGANDTEILPDAPTAPQPETYTVKYNGKTVDLTLDELKTRAQMGMNYEHVKSENDRIKNSQLYQTLRRVAQAEGVHIEELDAHLAKKERDTRLAALTQGGMQPDAAKQYLAMEESLSKAESREAELSPYVDFVRRFPEVRAEDIPEQVWDRFHETGDLIGAYTEAENTRLRAQISAMEQNKKNAGTHIGSLANDRPHTPTDAFLEGLLGG